MTFTSNPITLKDGAAADKSMIAYYDGTSSALAQPLLDNTGAIISPATSGKQDLANTALGAPGDAAMINPAASGSVIALLKGILTAAANLLPKGQANMANSSPVTIASDQPAIPVSHAASASGGVSTYSATGGTGNTLLTATPVAVKSSAGSLYGIDFINTNNADVYIQFFDMVAGSVVLGTTVPKISKRVPANGSREEKFAGEGRIAFNTAITIAATTTATGSTAPATGILANVNFK